MMWFQGKILHNLKGSMEMPLVEERYAEALIEITEANISTDKVLSDFDAVINLLDSTGELGDYLGNPQIQLDMKKKLLSDMFDGRIDESLFKLLLLLTDKARTKHIRGISDEYKRLADEKRNVLKLEIISAAQLDELQVEKICEKYAATYKKGKVSAVLQIDKSLIGGIKVQIGDRVEDYSVKTRFDSLRSLLIQD